MARAASGVYTLDVSNPVVTNTAISISWANDTLSDLATAMSDSLSRSGSGGMTAPLRTADGSVSAPSMAWTSETGSGFYRIGAGSIGLSILGVNLITYSAQSMVVAGSLVVGGASNFIVADAVTNTVTTANTITHSTSATPDVGIGVGKDFVVETVAGNEIGGQTQVVATNVDSGTEAFDFVINLMDAGGTASEVVRFKSTGEMEMPTGGTITINGATILTATVLGASVVTSSLTTVGTIGVGTWEGTAIDQTYLVGQSGTNTGNEVTATTSTEGILELGTQTEVDGTSGNTIVTPATLALRKGQMTLIETITNSSAGEFDFTSIPSTYTRLIIKGHLRGDVTAVEDPCLLIMNTDTTLTNYHTQRSGANNGAADVIEGANPEICIAPAASSPANSYGQVEIVIENYTGSHLKQASSDYTSYLDTDIIRNGSNSVVSVITAAITRLRVRSNNHATDQLFGELHLYGEQ